MRRKLDRSTTESASVIPDIQPDDVSEDDAETSKNCIYPRFKFAQITGEFDVRFFTGIPSTETMGDLQLKQNTCSTGAEINKTKT